METAHDVRHVGKQNAVPAPFAMAARVERITGINNRRLEKERKAEEKKAKLAQQHLDKKAKAALRNLEVELPQLQSEVQTEEAAARKLVQAIRSYSRQALNMRCESQYVLELVEAFSKAIFDDSDDSDSSSSSSNSSGYDEDNQEDACLKRIRQEFESMCLPKDQRPSSATPGKVNTLRDTLYLFANAYFMVDQDKYGEFAKNAADFKRMGKDIGMTETGMAAIYYVAKGYVKQDLIEALQSH